MREGWTTDLKHCSRYYWYISRIPSPSPCTHPPNIAGVSCQLTHTCILLWSTVFGQCEPFGDAREANVQPPRSMFNWFRGINVQSPCFNITQALWYKSYSIAPPWDPAGRYFSYTTSSLSFLFYCLCHFLKGFFKEQSLPKSYTRISISSSPSRKPDSR